MYGKKVSVQPSNYKPDSLPATIIEMIPKKQPDPENTDPGEAMKNYQAVLKKEKENIMRTTG